MVALQVKKAVLKPACSVLVMLLLSFVCLQETTALAAGKGLTVTTEQWARLRSSDDFMAIPGLKELVELLDQPLSDSGRTVLEIRYAGGEDGQLWARQVRNRLVGLGIEGDRIELVQGVAEANQLEIALGGNQ